MRSVVSRKLRGAGIALVLVMILLVCAGAATAAQAPKNIVIMIADGAAPTQWDFGRYASKVLRNQPFVTTDVVLDRKSTRLNSSHSRASRMPSSA